MNVKLTRSGGLTFSAVDAFGDPLEKSETGWARPYATDNTSPFWYASGDDDEDEDEDDDKGKKDEDDEDEDEEDDEDEDKGKTPEELAAEVKRLRTAYLKKLRQSKNRGTRLSTIEAEKVKAEEKLAEIEAELQTLRESSGKGGLSDDEKEAQRAKVEKMLERARNEGKATYKPVVIRMAAKADLLAAGARATVIDRLVKMIDTSDVDIDDEDGSIDVSDQVAALKKELPELFTAPKKRVAKVPAKDAGGGKGEDEKKDDKKKTSYQRQAERLRGGR
jgi:hypothetical protein